MATTLDLTAGIRRLSLITFPWRGRLPGIHSKSQRKKGVATAISHESINDYGTPGRRSRCIRTTCRWRTATSPLARRRQSESPVDLVRPFRATTGQASKSADRLIFSSFFHLSLIGHSGPSKLDIFPIRFFLAEQTACLRSAGWGIDLRAWSPRRLPNREILTHLKMQGFHRRLYTLFRSVGKATPDPQPQPRVG